MLRRQILITTLILLLDGVNMVSATEKSQAAASERQITNQPYGHILTNIGVWSPDSKWIVYDIRSDAAGEQFDGNRIERVHVDTGEVEVLYESQHGASCGVVTYSPTDDRVVFIHGPETPTEDWKYAAYHRRGVIVDAAMPGVAVNLDARDLVAPFTPGALRGGTHVHTFSGDGKCVAFTYEDHVLQHQPADRQADANQRNVGVSSPIRAVVPPPRDERNHAGAFFTVLVTRTANEPSPDSDQIGRAYSDAWIGRQGYTRPDGSQQNYAIAFQGQVATSSHGTIAEVFVVDLPENLSVPSKQGPLAGTSVRRPIPPQGTHQRRITFTEARRHPGIQGPRHWLRSSPDGSQIAFLAKDDNGVVQFYSVSPNGGGIRQITYNPADIESAFSWSLDGKFVAHVMDRSICVTHWESGKTHVLVASQAKSSAPRPEACVIAPNGRHIAYVRRVRSGDSEFNQIFLTDIPPNLTD